MSKTETAPTVGIAAQIHGEIAKLVQNIMSRHPDARHNVGKSILEAFVWDEIQKLSKGRSDSVWERMEKTGVYEKPLSVGRHECGESPHLLIKATVSEPIKRFNEDELLRVMEASEFKVPPHKMKGFVGAAKIPGNPMVRLIIVER
jgi:hypothetical protein